MPDRPLCVAVTGIYRGIGKAIAQRCAQEGWLVIGVDRLVPETTSYMHRFVQVDLAQPAEIEALFQSIAKQEGYLDVLVNNAAFAAYAPMDMTTLDTLDQILHVNIRAPYLCIQQALPLLRASSRASVINISSVHATQTSSNIVAYAASKGALSALTRAAALELAPAGIRVNAVAPGAIDTEMLREGLGRDHVHGDTVDERLAQLQAAHPLQRIGQPDDIAEAILYLADPTRSGFLTGASLVIDGGATIRLSTE